MKKYLFILLFSFTAAGVFAQMHKITIYSSFYRLDCLVQYLDYDKLYPDSINAAVMIDYKKKYLFKRNTYALLLRMNQDGWKLITITHDNKDGFPQYIMSKEVLLDDAAMNLYLQKLNGLKNSREDLLYP